eukprot:1959761-Prymnesium_polylepis.1
MPARAGGRLDGYGLLRDCGGADATWLRGPEAGTPDPALVPHLPLQSDRLDTRRATTAPWDASCGPLSVYVHRPHGRRGTSSRASPVFADRSTLRASRLPSARRRVPQRATPSLPGRPRHVMRAHTRLPRARHSSIASALRPLVPCMPSAAVRQLGFGSGARLATLTPVEISLLVSSCDVDGDGTIDSNEWCDRFSRALVRLQGGDL